MYIVTWNIPNQKPYVTYDHDDAIAEGVRIASTVGGTFTVTKID